MPTRSSGSSPRIAARIPGWNDLAMRDDTDQIAAYLAAAPNWGAEMSALRALALSCGLDEAIKWRKPCFIRKGADMTSTRARCARWWTPTKARVVFLVHCTTGSAPGLSERTGALTWARPSAGGLQDQTRRMVRRDPFGELADVANLDAGCAWRAPLRRFILGRAEKEAGPAHYRREGRGQGDSVSDIVG